MTNLTSEQYRDVIKHIPECTTEIPTVQNLLRKAVQTFFKRFGGYPELAGVAPGKIGILGEQTQFNGGLALPVATPMVTIVVGRKVPGTKFTVATSADVGKPHKVMFSFSRKRPLGPGCPDWLNYVKGVIENYSNSVPAFEAAIESTVPMGVGFGSSSALEVATYTFLEVLVGRKNNPIEKAKSLQKAEKDFAKKEVGLMDRITSILAKDRNAMLIDSKTNEVMWIPFRNPKVALVAVDTHLKDSLFGDEYKERTRYLTKACEILGIDNLREISEESLFELENRVEEILAEQVNEEDAEREEEENDDNEEENRKETSKEIWTKEDYDIMIKRARFFVTEMDRINKAIEAWKEGDIQTFGDQLKESHEALNENFDFNNPVLNFLVETSLQVDGVLGSRMTGMGLGFGGGIVTLVNKENVEEYCKYVTEKFAEHESELAERLKESRQHEKQKQHEIQKKYHTKHFNPSIASSEKIGLVQDLLALGGALSKVMQKRISEEEGVCPEKKKTPCIVKVEKPKGGCGTWANFQKERNKQEFLRKKSLEEEKIEEEKEQSLSGEETVSSVSQVSTVQLKEPNFYVVSPFTGARMMFVTKADILRSLFANPLPHPKVLVKSAMEVFKETYDTKIEAVALSPATMSLFGDFMEFQLGYIICMALPMYAVTVGGRNDTVMFNVKTTSKEVEGPAEMKNAIPSVRPFEFESRSWVNYVARTVSEFKGHVPGFSAIIHSNIPIKIGLNSCSAIQSCIYTYLEVLTRECASDVFEKIDQCSKSDYEFLPTHTELLARCSHIKFYPVFLCKEGHLMLINCKKYKISHYFFDNPAYVFLIAACKNITNPVTVESLEERLKLCIQAIDILNQKSLLHLDLKHLRCLKKRDASEEMIKRVKYIITEHQRTLEAVKAIQAEDYERVGLLMNESHASLRDDYEVSCPEIDELIELALNVEGVLGAKMIGRGLSSSIIILIKISDADKCIRYIKKNYKDKSDKPNFYITKPAGGAYAMNPMVDVPHIP